MWDAGRSRPRPCRSGKPPAHGPGVVRGPVVRGVWDMLCVSAPLTRARRRGAVALSARCFPHPRLLEGAGGSWQKPGFSREENGDLDEGIVLTSVPCCPCRPFTFFGPRIFRKVWDL